MFWAFVTALTSELVLAASQLVLNVIAVRWLGELFVRRAAHVPLPW